MIVDENCAELLASDLRAADFTVDVLDRLWGEAAAGALSRGFRLPAAEALAGDESPAALLARLFVLGLPADRATLQRAMPRLGADGAERLGLVTSSGRDRGDEVRPALDLRPYHATDAAGSVDWWIASDLGEMTRNGPLPVNHVLGIGGAGLTLAGLTVRRDVGRTLDLGTGCGIQALHASRHSGSVTATDISGRALRMAALNARINGCAGITFTESDLYDGLDGDGYDLLVSNPPFVITPRSADVPAYDYRDGGLVGDELVERVVRGAAGQLRPGGIAQLLGNWEYLPGVDGADKVAAWAGDAGLDVWVIEREVQDPCEYAETWIRDGGTRPGTADFVAMYAAWRADFMSRGVAAIGFGYVLLRRPGPGTRPLSRVEKLTAPLPDTSSPGAHLDACLSAHDRMAGEVRSWTLTRATDVTEERHYWPGAADPTAILLRQGGGFGRSIPIDTATAGVVGACDGDLTIGALIDAVASLTGAPASELSESVVPTIRKLVDDGILIAG